MFFLHALFYIANTDIYLCMYVHVCGCIFTHISTPLYSFHRITFNYLAKHFFIAA